MQKEILYATTNLGKVEEIGRHLAFHGISVLSLKDLNIRLEVSETGRTLEENAVLKAKAYGQLAGGRVVITDDTGLAIRALNGEPGIRVRYWKDGKTRMKDGEIIKYALQRLKGIPLEKRQAEFRSVVALLTREGKIETYSGSLNGVILEKADKLRFPGFPFESLFFVPEWEMLLGKVAQLPASKKAKFLNHREQAVEKAVSRIKELLV